MGDLIRATRDGMHHTASCRVCTVTILGDSAFLTLARWLAHYKAQHPELVNDSAVTS